MLFVRLYRYFNRHKPLMYVLLALTTAIFLFFAVKVEYEEDMSKLLPSTSSSETGLVFGNLKVKDKIFIQMTGQSPDVMVEYMDELMDSVAVCDTLISNMLYRLDADLPLSALDYAMEHVPSFVDTSLYAKFDEAIADVGNTMKHNADIIMNDETGSLTQMVATDPLNLRGLLMPSISSGIGFTIVDGHLFSSDSTVALAFVAPDFRTFDSKQGNILIEHIEKVAAQFKTTHPDVEVLFHGAPVRSSGNSRIMHKDIMLTIGLAMLVILLILGISFHSMKIIYQIVMPIVYGTIFSLSCIFWIKGGMSIIALGVGVFILGVAISYCLHIIIHQHYVCDVEKMLKDEAKPVCLGCLTTIGAILGLLFTQSDLLKDFGLFSTFLLLGSTMFSLVFLPHFIGNKKERHSKTIFNIVDKINNYPYDKNYLIIGVLVTVIIVGFIFTPKVKFDNNLKNIGYESDELLKSEALYASKSTNGLMQRYYAIAAPTLNDALDANKTLATVLDSMRATGTIKNYTPVVSILFQSDNEQDERIKAWRDYWTDDKIEATMDAVSKAAADNEIDPEIFDLFRMMLEADYEPGDLYDADIIPDGLLCNFIEQSDDSYLIFNATQIEPSNKSTIDDRVAQMPRAVVVDPFYYTGNMIDIIHDDFNTTLVISSVFVLVVLLLSFRNIMVALVAFLPMFLSWYVVQGWMAIFGLQFNLINIIVSTFIFGIGVDYSIFVVQGLIAEASGRDTRLLAYHKMAIFFSALTLFVVMIAMLFATHPSISSIGVCTLIGMSSTIMITYTIQPLLFRLLQKFKFFKKSLK